MENYNKRWIAILYYFLDHKDIANGDKIALSVGVSSRTIRNDIKELNTLLVQYDAEIVSEIGIGYFLKINDNQKFQNFLEEIWIYVNIVDTKTQIFMQFFLKHLQAVEE